MHTENVEEKLLDKSGTVSEISTSLIEILEIRNNTYRTNDSQNNRYHISLITYLFIINASNFNSYPNC